MLETIWKIKKKIISSENLDLVGRNNNLIEFLNPIKAGGF